MLAVEELFQRLAQGSTWDHVTWMISSLFAFSFLHHVFVSRFTFKSSLSKVVLFLFEVFFICLCPALVHTFWSNHIPQATCGAVVAGLLLLLIPPKCDPGSVKTPSQDIKNVVLMTTCMVITAVDCRLIFDVRFTKTVQYGWSAMDVGTGLFVALRALHDARPFKPQHFSKKLIGNTPNFLIFGALGVGRSLFIAISGYYQDIMEYGKHWNFFLTLLCIEAVIYFDKQYFIPWTKRLTRFEIPNVSFFIGTAYVVFLIVDPSFETYLLGREPERSGGIFDQNREGFCSIFGYLFIYGVLLEHNKRVVPSDLWRYESVAYSTTTVFKNLLKNSIHPLAYLLLLYIAVYHYDLQPSRRAANLTYGLWMMSIAFQGGALSLFYHQLTARPDIISTRPQPLLVHTAIAHNGAAVFLVANLLTGLSNYLRDPLELYTEAKEFGCLCVYSVLLCLFAYLLEYGKKHKTVEHKKHGKLVSSNFEEILGYDHKGLLYDDEEEPSTKSSSPKTPFRRSSVPSSEARKRMTHRDLSVLRTTLKETFTAPANSSRSERDQQKSGESTPTGRPTESLEAEEKGFSFKGVDDNDFYTPRPVTRSMSKSPSRSLEISPPKSNAPVKKTPAVPSKIPAPAIRRSSRTPKPKTKMD
ncbi:unnamed protein product [Bursaphelenchus xylophilus]|nr:unnamed protein product [Bursaphelenchus xylophilus]CAG9100134.1 unnamed protein product [Bursaphelenchus xylophilus]